MVSYKDIISPPPSASTSHVSRPGRPTTGAISDSDSDLAEDLPIDIRNSLDLARYDRTVLEDEDEQAQLLSSSAGGASGGGGGGGGMQSFQARIKAAKRAQRDARRLEQSVRDHARSGRKSRAGEVMYSADDRDGRPSSSESSAAASDDEKIPFRHRAASRRPSKKFRFLRMATLHALAVMLFAAIAYGAYRATTSIRQRKHSGAGHAAASRSNGTSSFGPTTIYLSLDGFRADFLDRGLTPNLAALAAQGMSAPYMLPSFPSVTFPNHYTLMTGLYPESHGVVSNSFWDPTLREGFFYTDRAHSMQPKWWPAEPLWVTAQAQGVPTAIHMWPGSEAHLGPPEPAYVDKFNASEVLDRKVDRILGFLDLPGESDEGYDEKIPRPRFVAAYVPDVDADGHLFGPNSTQITDTIRRVDRMVGSLVAGLASRNLTNVVNLLVVSDHGMATTATERVLQFEDLVDPTLLEHVDGWPHYGLRPKEGVDVLDLRKQIAEHPLAGKGFDVYLKDDDMPLRYHFTRNERIAPLWIFPRTGWAIATKDEYDVAALKKEHMRYHPAGIHGYDNQDPLMRAIFIARGPAFPEGGKHERPVRLPVFENVNVYNILCDTLGVEPLANNGTMRLPLDWTLQPEAELETPVDTPDEGDTAPEDSSGDEDDSEKQGESDKSPERPTIDDGSSDAKDGEGEGGPEDEQHGGFKSLDDFLGWLGDKLNGLSDWAKGLTKGKGQGGETQGDTLEEHGNIEVLLEEVDTTR